MSKNRSNLIRAFFAISLMLFVVCFIVFKSGAIESHTEIKMVNGKSQEQKTHRFNAGKIPIYLRSIVAPLTGEKAVSND